MKFPGQIFEKEKNSENYCKNATISVQSQVQQFYNAAHMPSANLQNNTKNVYF
jgi:hypothetical protein